jgi:uncharacterized protein
MLTTEKIIEFFDMKPLPDEGGFFVETYRAEEKITQTALPPRYSGDRNFSTAILYLLTSETFSKLHKVKSDEVFHFYLGDDVTMLQLFPGGKSKVTELGSDITNNQHIQLSVPQGIWQGCLLNKSGGFALMGCTVSPGFEFSDYQSADRGKLLAEYPDRRNLIIRLT